jgi:hypothetical protein
MAPVMERRTEAARVPAGSPSSAAIRQPDPVEPSHAGVWPRGAKRTGMLLRNRPPGIGSTTVAPRAGFEHLEPKSIAVLRWLNANKIDYVVVGPVAHAIRGDATATGPVAIVPAPYGRNFDRLARALTAEHAALRSERGIPGAAQRGDAVAIKLTGEKLRRGRRWKLRFGDYDLDVESSGNRPAADGATPTSAAPGARQSARSIGASGARYQELLYEANRFEVADGVSAEVASPEDLEHFSHVRRTGTAPEFTVTRNDAGVDVPESEGSGAPTET